MSEPRVYPLSGPGAPTADYVLATDYAALRARLVVAEQQNETYKKQFAILNGSVHIHYEEKIAAQKRLAEVERELQAIQATVGDTEFALREQVAKLERERDEACGELMVSLDDAPIGSLAGKLVTANRVLRQQLAASQARCREMEAVRHDYKATLTDAELSDKEYMTAYCSDFHADYGLALKRLAQLQARLAVLEKGFADQTALRERHEAGFTETIAQLQATLAAREATIKSIADSLTGAERIDAIAKAIAANSKAVQEVTRLRLTWTTARPTVAGWYWVKWPSHPQYGPEVREVAQPNGPDTDELEVDDMPIDEYVKDCRGVDWQPVEPARD